jgi:hypothetical protein
MMPHYAAAADEDAAEMPRANYERLRHAAA